MSDSSVPLHLLPEDLRAKYQQEGISSNFGSEGWLVDGKSFNFGRVARLLVGVVAAAFTTGFADLVFTFWDDIVVKSLEALGSFLTAWATNPLATLTSGISDAWDAANGIFAPFGPLAPFVATAVLMTSIVVAVWIVRRWN